MEEIADDNNKMIEENIDTDENEFTYNFIDIPWDDRTKRSKVFIVLLLLTIFSVTMGLVINNFVAHYNNLKQDESFMRVNCNLLKVDEYLYVARILSVSSQQLICVGAVISENSVLASEVCLKSETVRVYVGSVTDQHCKKGFSVGAVEPLPQNLVLVSTHMKISHCANVIQIGTNVNRQSHAFIVGRPLRGERSLSQQLVSLDIPDNYTYSDQLTDKHLSNDICVKYLSRCPVRPSDLLVQDEQLLGIASTGIQRRTNGVVCFANVSRIKPELKKDVG